MTSSTTVAKLQHVTIKGLTGTWSEIDARYDYAADPTKCPVCGGLGFAWGGWFTCDDGCTIKALVSDGRVFANDDPDYRGI